MPLPARLEQTYAGLVSELPYATRALHLTAAFNDSHSLRETLDAATAAFDRRITLDELEPAISARLVSVENGFELRLEVVAHYGASTGFRPRLRSRIHGIRWLAGGFLWWKRTVATARCG